MSQCVLYVDDRCIFPLMHMHLPELPSLREVHPLRPRCSKVRGEGVSSSVMQQRGLCTKTSVT